MTGAVGFAHYDGKLLLLPGLLPGEEAEFSTAIPHKGRLAAKDLVRLTSSDVRITPSCPYSSVCGGCGFDYVGPEASARLKSAIVRENIESRTGCDLSPVIKEPIWAEGEGYRSRCRIHVSLKDRKLGFLSKRSNELVAIDHCPLLTERLNGLLAQPKELFRRFQSQLFAKGVNRKTGFVELELFDADDGVLIGDEEGVVTVGGRAFHLTASVFFQSNLRLLPRLFSIVEDSVVPRRVMDLYSGVGTFSTVLEGGAYEVVAVERDRACLALARKNAPSARFFTDDVSLWARKDRGGVDTVIVDPPRTGLGDAASLIASWSAGRVVYVSCNSQSLAWDLKAFMGKYTISSVRVLDFYPGSGHEETVVVLDRR